VFRIPILRGREFDQRDAAGATPVVIISEAFAKRYWPNADPLGQQILIGKGIMRELAGEVPRQILGIVGDVRDDALNNEPGPAMYVPQAQVPDALNELNLRISPMAWVIRTERDPRPLSTLIQEELRQASGLPIGNIRTMEEVVSRSTSRERFNMLLMSVFASTALLLAGIGIYGLMAYAVEQRTQEIGIRLALGAQLSEVQNMVVRQGMVFAAAGVGIGIGAALWLVRFIQAFLYGVQPWDPAVFIGVPVTLSLIALLAVWIPARRAARIDPMIALRYE
jgi:predicted permease